MSTSKYKQRLAKERKAAAIVAAQRAAERRRRRTVVGAVAGVVALIAVVTVVVARSGDDGSSSADATSATTPTGFTYGTAECAPPDGAPSPGTLDFPDTDGFQKCIDPTHVYTATITTSVGTVEVQLEAADVPGTVNNFVQLAGWGYYNGTQLFRTDPSLGIIQGGSPHTNSASDPGPGFTIDDEGSGFTYQPGQLVMARTDQPNSGGGQFFFTVTDAASNLDAQGTYVVFGQVTSGLDVLEKILATDADGHPEPPVTLTSIVIGEASLVNGTPSTGDPTASTLDPAATVPKSTTTTATVPASSVPESTVDPSASTPKTTATTLKPA